MVRAAKRPKFKSSPTEIEIDLVTLEWNLPWSRRGSETASGLLARLAAVLPEAVPRRFGDCEPFSQKLDCDGEDAFRALWQQEATTPGLQMLFFSATAPCFGGNVCFSSEASRQTPECAPMVSIVLEFDGRSMGDPFWRDSLVALFADVARSLGAFHAIAYLEPGRTTRLNRYWATASAPAYPLPRGDRWCGIPDVPGWLTWLGAPYAERVLGAAEGAERSPEGVLIRTSEAPLPLERIEAGAPPLPSELLLGPRSVRATEIPPLS